MYHFELYVKHIGFAGKIIDAVSTTCAKSNVHVVGAFYLFIYKYWHFSLFTLQIW